MIEYFDKPKSFCGIFGVYGAEDASLLTYYGLHALQHRGQEASGIVSRSFDDNGKPSFNIIKGEGLVSEVFTDYDIWGKDLTGNSAIGHNRYSTTGSSQSRKNIQPFIVNYHHGNLGVAHNGNLTNETELRRNLVAEGSIFQTTSDTEVILHLVAKSKESNQVDQIIEAVSQLKGAFGLVILTDNLLVAARDPYGFRPLCLGKKNGSYIVTSETCALDIISAQYIRDVEPGEILIFDQNTLETGEFRSLFLEEKPQNYQHCIFEYIYFSRPDSRIFNHSVDKVRRRLGKILANNHPVQDPDGDKVIVISVPDSSNTAALGYARQLSTQGIAARFELGLIRSHYIGRTFIEPGQKKREIGVKIKFNVVKGILEGKTVVVVDDSIVRGTTSKSLVNLIREANPKSIHMRISSPPIMNPCFYGMDFPSKEELIANQMEGNIEKIRDYIGLDSLEFLTIDELVSSVREDDPANYCTACFSGNYPTEVNFAFKKDFYDVK